MASCDSGIDDHLCTNESFCLEVILFWLVKKMTMPVLKTCLFTIQRDIRHVFSSYFCYVMIKYLLNDHCETK